MLKQRLITAIGLIILIGWGVIYLSTPYFAGLVALFVTAGAFEWVRLVNLKNLWQGTSFALLVLLIMALLWYFENVFPYVTWIILVIAIIWWIIGIFWVARFYNQFVLSSYNVGLRLACGILLLIPAWLALVWLHMQYGPIYVFFLLFLTAVGDSGAFFVGRRWGKNKLAPNISPGKTWEGVWGAVVAVALYSIIVGIYILPYSMLGYRFWSFVLLCLVTLVFSIFGDLFESMIKRQVGVKDSGNILPGHGGVLDRIDSLTAAAPVFAFGLMLLEIY